MEPVYVLFACFSVVIVVVFAAVIAFALLNATNIRISCLLHHPTRFCPHEKIKHFRKLEATMFFFFLD